MTVLDFDVIVLGSGPAGSTASTLLVRQGHKVLMIERSRHPKFHIGESLLPMSAPIFARLGIQWDTSEYLPKGGAEFINEQSGQRVRFSLADEHQPYQVERAKFDHMMVQNAVNKGAELRQEETANQIDIQDDRVHVTTDKGEYAARYFIDASGRSAFMGRQQTAIERINNLGRFALYTHYRHASSEAARCMYASGDIKVLMLDIGWVWIIPLVNQRISVGIVVKEAHSSSLKGEALFQHYRHASPTLNAVLDGTEQEAPIRSEANFSFTNRQRHGKRFACCGDAAGFLDPIFSSGVFLATNSAERVADRVDRALKENDEGRLDLHVNDDKDHMLGFRSMQLFVERFYQYDLVHHLFFEAGRDERIEKDITGLLSGKLWSGDNSFQKTLMKGRQARRTPS
ncbi:FIG022199: FAD-binding protein [hydrothermal vent metagenome]|uniref:FIG022199: FAD-binding protein n=1 Tax=hydrothermal vent metagenome TaxID=652676 RepID=A0A3B0Z8Y6_9ZZZZ